MSVPWKKVQSIINLVKYKAYVPNSTKIQPNYLIKKIKLFWKKMELIKPLYENDSVH